jgi:chromosome partitioning protein
MNNIPYVIVIGNEKGGAGKTTTSVHLIISLLQLGFNVSSIDVDCRQLSLTRYLENRQKYMDKHGQKLLMPYHSIGKLSNANEDTIRQEEEKKCFEQLLGQSMNNSDFVVIDTPGSDTFMSRLAHSYANMVITPINDSFMDLDVLAHIEADTINPEKLSIYSQTIWEQKMNKAKREQKEIEWVVIRNRLSHLDAINKRNVSEALRKLSQRVGFKIAQGFSERVIFRELFLQGLTLLDIMDRGNVNISHVAARQELRSFLRSLNISKINDIIEKSKEESKVIV